jgi:hypothetical protein
LFPGQIKDVTVEVIALKGPVKKKVPADANTYIVLLPLEGDCIIHTTEQSWQAAVQSLIRIPYNHAYTIEVEGSQRYHYLRIIRQLDEKDIEEIARHKATTAGFYARKFADCPVYREDIKSAKTENRMLLPENYVPRFCLGSVETIGPDQVDAHEHSMLDQLFLGLKNCNAMCYAGDASTPLLENTLLHIPLGSRHSVSVDKGNTLYYLWFDFFLSLKGQSYMSQQHQLDADKD